MIGDFSAAGSRLNVGLSEDEQIVLEPINGTRDFRINSKKDADDKPWFDGRDLRFIHCVRPAKCERIQNNTCFGSKLPYAMTSLALTDSKSQEESREKLYNYEALRNIPKCWAVIQVPHPAPPVNQTDAADTFNCLLFCSRFYVQFLHRSANASKIEIWFICLHWKCVASQWNRAAYCTIPHFFPNF